MSYRNLVGAIYVFVALVFLAGCITSLAQETVYGLYAPWPSWKLSPPTPTPTPTPPPGTADLVVDDSGGEDFTTIGAAYSAASCGDLIHVREGTYTLTATLNLNKTCTEGNEIVIQNYPEESPEVTCSSPATGFKRVENNGAFNVWDGIDVYGCFDGIKVYKGDFTVKNSSIYHNLYQGIIIAVTSAELSNITIEGNEIYRNGYALADNDVTCNDAGWGGDSPKHCHGIYISDFGCNGTDNIDILDNHIHDHGGRAIQWNGEGCSSKMKNTLVQGNTLENNSRNIILWHNVEDAVINDNDFIASSFPETDDTSHGHFSIINSPGNTITNNRFYSDLTTYEQLQMLDSGSDVGMTVDGNIWGYRNTSWKWDNSWRSDFDTDYLSVSGWDSGGCTSLYTSFPCTP